MIKQNYEFLYDEKYLVYKFAVTSKVWHIYIFFLGGGDMKLEIYLNCKKRLFE
jgi:hypothetical protein